MEEYDRSMDRYYRYRDMMKTQNGICPEYLKICPSVICETATGGGLMYSQARTNLSIDWFVWVLMDCPPKSEERDRRCDI